MKLRLKFFGALLALLAFSAYFAETVWASTKCSPEMQASAVEPGAEFDTTEHPCPTDVEHPAPTESESSGHSSSGNPICPLAPMSATNSCAAAFLPAPGVSSEAPWPVASHVFPDGDALPDLLLAAALFHPPRA